MTANRTDLAYAQELDRQDQLAHFRGEFVIDDPDLIYLDGNSLGRLPKRTKKIIEENVAQGWGRRLIRGWGDGWFRAPQRIGAKIAQVIGAQGDEVICSDSTTTNFYKLVIAALKARPGRTKMVTDDMNFPTDRYILQGVAREMGLELVVVRSEDSITISTEALAEAIDEQTALVTLTHTAFKSAYIYDMQRITEMAHRAGALMLWDLCHSAGAMPLALNACEADLAVGCTYKYLNGGPGSPAFLYVRRDLQEGAFNPIWGWFSQKNQFEMAEAYQAAPGLDRFLTGTPPMLSMIGVEVGVDLILEAGLDRLREKSVQQTEYLIALWEEFLKPLGFSLNSPRDAHVRGSHVSIGHEEGLRIDRALIDEMKVLPDFRYPDNIRLGIAPSYTTFAEIHEAVMRIRQVVADRLYEKYPMERPEVT